MTQLVAILDEGDAVGAYAEGFDPVYEDDLLHAQINGESSPGAVDELWVNEREYGRPGIGAGNVQPFVTSATAHAQRPQSVEQGWGMDPGREWASYPVTEGSNPYRDIAAGYRRNGTDAYVANVYRPELALIVRTQQARELGALDVKQRGSGIMAVVPLAPSVPYVQTVPTYAGGPAPIPGVDVPVYGHPMYGADEAAALEAL